MKKYVVDIAPGYGPGTTGSLTDGRHGTVVTAADMDAAVAVTKAHAKRESWPAGDVMVTELDRYGQRVDRPGHWPRRITI